MQNEGFKIPQAQVHPITFKMGSETCKSPLEGVFQYYNSERFRETEVHVFFPDTCWWNTAITDTKPSPLLTETAETASLVI